MAAALILPISGPYTGNWDAYYLGMGNDDGFVLLGQYNGQEINLTDQGGMTLLEAIWRGLNWRVRFRGLEFDSDGLLSALQAFGSTGARNTTFTPTMANIGQRYSARAAPLALTAILANPPTMPQTLTATNSIMAPGHTVEMLMTSKMKEVPLEWVLLPYAATVGSLSVNLAFTTT